MLIFFLTTHHHHRISSIMSILYDLQLRIAVSNFQYSSFIAIARFFKWNSSSKLFSTMLKINNRVRSKCQKGVSWLAVTACERWCGGNRNGTWEINWMKLYAINIYSFWMRCSSRKCSRRLYFALSFCDVLSRTRDEDVHRWSLSVIDISILRT